jgi:hypothetical protein
MPVEPMSPQIKLPASLLMVLDQLACPVCRQQLEIGDDRLACTGCGRVYPIVDGIPVLIPDRAEMARA